MRRLFLGVAAATAAAVIPSASFATDSGTVSAGMTVGYSCTLDTPSQQTLVASGTTATASANLPYAQNGSTTYTLSNLTLTDPTGASTTGSITLSAQDGTQIVTNGSASSAASSTYPDSASGTGTIAFAVEETVLPAFVEGNYLISATLSCAEQE